MRHANIGIATGGFYFRGVIAKTGGVEFHIDFNLSIFSLALINIFCCPAASI